MNATLLPTFSLFFIHLSILNLSPLLSLSLSLSLPLSLSLSAVLAEDAIKAALKDYKGKQEKIKTTA